MYQYITHVKGEPVSLLHRRAALKDRIPGGRDGRRMLGITLVDKVGNGLWTATQALYFTYVTGLSITEVGLLIAVSAGIGIAGAPIAGRVADRLPITRVLIAAQLVRAAAGLALLTTDHFAVLLAIAAFGSLGDRGANVLTKLYAARIAGSERVRYQAVNRTVGNTGFAIGGLAAAAALGVGTTTAYQSLLIGNALTSVCAALLTLRCGEPPPRRASSTDPRARPSPQSPPTPGATVRISSTWPVKRCSSSTMPSSWSGCRSGSCTPPRPRTAWHRFCSS